MNPVNKLVLQNNQGLEEEVPNGSLEATRGTVLWIVGGLGYACRDSHGWIEFWALSNEFWAFQSNSRPFAEGLTNRAYCARCGSGWDGPATIPPLDPRCSRGGC